MKPLTNLKKSRYKNFETVIGSSSNSKPLVGSPVELCMTCVV